MNKKEINETGLEYEAEENNVETISEELKKFLSLFCQVIDRPDWGQKWGLTPSKQSPKEISKLKSDFLETDKLRYVALEVTKS